MNSWAVEYPDTPKLSTSMRLPPPYPHCMSLEPISKLLEEHGDASELYKTQEVGGVVFPANQQPPLPLEPGKEPFDEPATLIPPQMAAILGLELASGPVWRNQVHPVLLEVVIEPVAVVGPIPNEMFGLGLQHVEVETQLHQRDLMMIRGVRPDREREPMPIHNGQDFHPLAAFREAHAVATALCRGKRGIDKALAFIKGAFVAQRIRQLCEDLAQHFTLAPLLKAAMDRLVVGIALRQHVPLGPGVQNPQDCFQDRPCGDGFAARPSLGDVFLGEMVPKPLPLFVAQAQHERIST